MPSILVWGKIRELVAGEMPLGISAQEVTTLAELQAHLDAKGGTLILADAAHLEAERPGLEAWLKSGGSLRALLVAVAEQHEADDLLRRYPFLDDFLVKPVTTARVRLRLDRALDSIHSRRVIQQLDLALARKSQELTELNKIGVALSAERDINKLLELILLKSREITAADAGSLYLVKRGKDENSTEDDQLSFELTQNDSVLVNFEKFPMPLNEASIAGYVALTGQPVNAADVYNLPAGAPYKASGGAARSFDE